jgi:hypothetical protein
MFLQVSCFLSACFSNNANINKMNDCVGYSSPSRRAIASKIQKILFKGGFRLVISELRTFFTVLLKFETTFPIRQTTFSLQLGFFVNLIKINFKGLFVWNNRKYLLE